MPNAADHLDVMVRVLAFSGRPIRRFLDVGAGSGVLSAAIAARFPDARGLLIDFSEPMLDQAKRLLPSPPHQLRLVDFSDASWVGQVRDWAPFDAIVSGFAIHHQPDDVKRRIYADIFGLLAPGAPFVHIEHVASASPWIGNQFDELLVDRMYEYDRSIGGGRTRDQVAREYVYRPDKAANILAPLDDQLEWMRAIGFADVDCLFKIYELAVFAGRRPESNQGDVSDEAG